MYRKTISIGALALLLPIAAPQAAHAQTVSLKPASQWNVDFGDTRCRLARIFGEGEDQHILFFDQHYPNDAFGMTVAGPGLKRFSAKARTQLQFYTSQAPRKTEPFKGEAGAFGAAVIFGSAKVERTDDEADATPSRPILQIDTDSAAKVEFVSLAQGKRRVLLQTGPLEEAFKVMNTCTQDMIRDWGLDVEKHLTATKHPVWTNSRAITRKIQNDYPATGLRRGEQAVMQMRIIVDEAGSVEKCVIDKATDTERLESPACNPMRKAKFEPALDADGKPFRSYYATPITYLISP